MFDKERYYTTFKGIQGLKISLDNMAKDYTDPTSIINFFKYYLNIEFKTRTYIEENSYTIYFICKNNLENLLTGEVADIVIRELKYINEKLNIIKLTKNNIQEVLA